MRNAFAQFPGEATLVLAVMEELSQVQTREDFIKCTQNSFQYVLAHEVMCSAMGVIGEGKPPRGIDFVSNNFPIDFVVDTHGPNGDIESEFFDRWVVTEEPQLFQPDRDADNVDKRWLAAFKKHDLGNLVSYGIKGRPLSEPSTYFAFARVQGPLGPRHVRIMKLLGPHIHVTLTRVFAASIGAGGPTLTDGVINDRQREILRCIRRGLTNREIMRELSLTEKAVKYHVGKILQKLEVSNRTQAVAKAVVMKLIS